MCHFPAECLNPGQLVTHGGALCPACLKLYWDVGWGCRGEGKTAVITRQSVRDDKMLEFSCIFSERKEENFFTAYEFVPKFV